MEHCINTWARVIIADLYESQLENLQYPKRIQTYLNSRFGSDVQQRGFNVQIVDRITSSGQKTKGGKVLRIEPVVYQGVKVFSRTGRVHQANFAVDLFFKDSAHSVSPSVRRKGSDRIPLAQIEGFDHEPWTLVAGYVDFPKIADDENLWDSQKRKPKQSRVRKAWEDVLHQWEDEIQKTILKVKERLSEEQDLDFAQDLVKATRDALRQLSYFSELSFSAPGVTQPERSFSGSTSKKVKRDYIMAIVLNEHGQGVSMVDVELWPSANPNEVVRKKTGVSGRIRFGQLPMGKYRVYITPPKGTVPHAKYPTSKELMLTRLHMKRARKNLMRFINC